MSASTPSVTSAEPATSLQQRLSEQLQALSQVGERLTLRLLELEERLEGLEQQLNGLQPSGASAGSLTGALLEATAERISRLEELLNGSGEPGAGASSPSNESVEADTAPRLEAVRTAGNPDDYHEQELELNPFPDDEEQPFMDELSA